MCLYNMCLQPLQGYGWHYANGSTIVLPLLLPSCSSVSPPLLFLRPWLDIPLIELYSLSNLLKSVLALTSTIEILAQADALQRSLDTVVVLHSRLIPRSLQYSIFCWSFPSSVIIKTSLTLHPALYEAWLTWTYGFTSSDFVTSFFVTCSIYTSDPRFSNSAKPATWQP